MPTFKKRVFGAEVEEDVILEFQRLATGGRIVETKTTPRRSGVEGEILKSVNPTYEDYLGDKTPQCRMWCAVSVNEWSGWGNYKGEKIFQNSNNDWFYYPNNDKDAGSTKTVGKDSEATRLVFSVNQHNEENNYSNPLESTDVAENSSSKIKHFKQLSNNPHMKPAAGITSIRAKSQGAIGAIISATVEFVVHNKFDFDNIFLPYFLKPGSIVCLDYGWSDVSMYDIISAVKRGDINMDEFDNDIYNSKTGFQARNFGKVRTVMGNVVNYNANVTNEGSYECSIEIVSRNAGLLEKKVERDLQNLFVNSINDVIAIVLAKSFGVDDIDFSLDHIRKNLNSADPIDTRVVAKRLISELSDIEKGNKNFIGFIPDEAVKKGIFHQDMAANKPFNSTAHSTRLQEMSDKPKSATELRQEIVTDDILNKERTYISYGLFEDLFLNNFAKGVIKNKLEIDTSGNETGQQVTSKVFQDKPGVDFDSNFDTRLTYIRWSENLLAYQRAEMNEGQSLPIFMIPDNWDNSYNAIKLGINLEETDADKLVDKDSDIKYNVSTADQISGKHPNYKGVNVMPLRDLFISVNMIQTSFQKQTTVNDALVSIFDEINDVSGNTIGLRIVTNEASSTISAQDINLNPIEEKRLEFDVTGTRSIVSNLDLKYSTPKDGLSSILAIGNLNGPQRFDDLDLSQFSYLNIMNKQTDKYVHIRSLPSQGNLNRFTSEEGGLTLNLSGVNKFLSTYTPSVEEDSSPENAQQKMDFYYQMIKQTGLVEEEEDSGSSDGTTSFTNSKAYAYDMKRANTYKSEREIIQAKLREELYDDDSDGSIAPILPIELSLGIYGNTYLQIGDKFTINYLPDYYKNRVYFQIMQFEDEITPNGWTTNYQSLMRVEPKVKSIISGGGKIPIPKLLNPNEFKRSKNTSVVLIIKNVEPNVVTAVDDMSANKVALVDINNDGEVTKKLKEANLSFKARKITFDTAEQWTAKTKVVNITTVNEVALRPSQPGGAPVTVATTGKQITKTTDYTHFLKYDFTSYTKWNELKNIRSLAYGYAIRKLILGEDSPIDFTKIKVKFVTGVSNSKDIDKLLKDSMNEYDLIAQLDQVDGKGSEKDITDLGGIVIGYLEAISKVDFNLHPKLFESPGIPTELDQNNFTYKRKAATLSNDVLGWLLYKERKKKEFDVPLFVLRFFFGLNTEKDLKKTQEAIVISNITDIEVFKHLSIPKHMLKADVDHKTIIKNICKYFKEYEDAMYGEDFIGPT